MSGELDDIRQNIFQGMALVRVAIGRIALAVVVLAAVGYMVSAQAVDRLARPVKELTRIHDQPILSLPADLARRLELHENETVNLRFAEDDSVEAVIQHSFASGIVFTAPAEAFVTRLKIAVAIAVLLGFPFFVFQIVRLFAHRIPTRPLRAVYISIPLISALFYLGVFVCITVVIPLGLEFLLGFQTGTLKPMISISEYMSFIILFSFLLGLIFEMPLLIAVLARYRLVTPGGMMEKRSAAYMGFIALAAILTPPDIISQVLIGLPLIFLYEIGIFIAWATPKHKPRPAPAG